MFIRFGERRERAGKWEKKYGVACRRDCLEQKATPLARNIKSEKLRKEEGKGKKEVFNEKDLYVNEGYMLN